MSVLSTLAFGVLIGFGAVSLLSTSYIVVRFLALHFITPSKPLKSYQRAGSGPAYALITGASAGIGFGTARALVKEGFNVILLGHLEDELNSAKAALQSLRANAVVKIIVMNVQTATPDEMKVAVSSISDLPITILFNNVGGNPVKLPAFRNLGTHSCEDVDAVINHNARFMARFTALMLPILSRKAGPNERSLILSSSSGAKVGVPHIIMYGATKGFNWSFSVGLARELAIDPATKHVDALCIVPGEVRSQGNSEGVSTSEPDANEFGQLIVNKVDGALAWGQRDLSPCWKHDLNDKILGAIPESLGSAGITDVLNHKKQAFNSAWEKSR